MKQRDFEQLILRWAEEGIIDATQKQYLLADLQHSTAEQSGKKFVITIATVGATVLVAGVLLLIASNWQFLGKSFQVFLALLMPLFPLMLAYYLSAVKRSQSILVLVANIFGVGLIGASLALIGQIYNLESGYSSLLWWWAVLSTPFVFVFKRAENLVVSAALFGVALMFLYLEMVDDSDESAFVLVLTVSALAYAGLLYAIGTILRSSTVWASGARLLRLMSASVASVVLFITTFEFYARLITDVEWNSSGWIPLSILLNITFIAFLLFVLVRAFRAQEERLALSVVRLLFLYVIVKYFTLFSSMLDTGVLLVLGGMLFITGAWYLEKHKIQLLTLMRQEVREGSSGSNVHSTQSSYYE